METTVKTTNGRPALTVADVEADPPVIEARQKARTRLRGWRRRERRPPRPGAVLRDRDRLAALAPHELNQVLADVDGASVAKLEALGSAGPSRKAGPTARRR